MLISALANLAFGASSSFPIFPRGVGDQRLGPVGRRAAQRRRDGALVRAARARHALLDLEHGPPARRGPDVPVHRSHRRCVRIVARRVPRPGAARDSSASVVLYRGARRPARGCRLAAGAAAKTRDVTPARNRPARGAREPVDLAVRLSASALVYVSRLRAQSLGRALSPESLRLLARRRGRRDVDLLAHRISRARSSRVRCPTGSPAAGACRSRPCMA